MISTHSNAPDHRISSTILLIFESFVILILTIALWYDNFVRPQWFWLFWCAVPIFALRWRLQGRLWTHTPLHDVALIFIVLTALNYDHALFQKESYLAATARPLSGIWTFIHLIEWTRTTRRLRISVGLVVGMGFFLAVMALTGSQWVVGKSSFLYGIANALPAFDYRSVAAQWDQVLCAPIISLVHSEACFSPGMIIQRGLFSFNVNEIGGASVWMAPFLAGIALVPWLTSEGKHTPWRIISGLASVSFIMLSMALILGQSRFAMLGFMTALALLIFFSIQPVLWRRIAWGALALVIVLQGALFLNLFTPDRIAEDTGTPVEVGLTARDENSVVTRLQIWNRGWQMMRDQPMTGVGMYMYRTAVAQPQYEIPYFQEQNNPPPHSHNQWIHMAAEMGVPGVMIFIAMQLAVGWMLWISWSQGDMLVRQITLATAAGLIGQMIYGLGDTIALWDRFQFIFWWLLGVAGSVYVMTRMQTGHEIEEVTVETVS